MFTDTFHIFSHHMEWPPYWTAVLYLHGSGQYMGFHFSVLKLWDIGCILLHIYHSDLGGVDKRNILTLQAHLR